MTVARATIIAAVITAAASIVVAVITVGFSHGSASPTVAGETSHAGVTGPPVTSAATSSQADSAPSTSAASGSSAVLWHGQMTLTDDSDGPGVDVGEVPPQINQNGPGSTSFWLYQGQFETGQDAENLMGEWDSASAPTVDQCAGVLRTAPVEKISARSGLQFCTHGLFDRRIAFVHVLSYDGNKAQIDVTIWNEQLPWS